MRPVRGGLAHSCSLMAFRRSTARSPQVVLEPNLTYWDPKRTPKVRIVYENAIVEGRGDPVRRRRETGRVDVVTDLSPAEAHAFQGGSVAAIQAQPAKTVLAGVFNENKPDSPWGSLEVRRALNMAIDRDAVVRAGRRWLWLRDAGVHPAGPLRRGAWAWRPIKLDTEAAAAVHGEGGPEGARKSCCWPRRIGQGVVEVLTENLAKVGLTVRADYSKTEPEGWDIKLVWHFDWSPQYPGRRRAPRVLRQQRRPPRHAGGPGVRRAVRQAAADPAPAGAGGAWCGRSSNMSSTRPARWFLVSPHYAVRGQQPGELRRLRHLHVGTGGDDHPVGWPASPAALLAWTGASVGAPVSGGGRTGQANLACRQPARNQAVGASGRGRGLGGAGWWRRPDHPGDCRWLGSVVAQRTRGPALPVPGWAAGG